MVGFGETGEGVARAFLGRRGVNLHLVRGLVSDGIGFALEACLFALKPVFSWRFVRNIVCLVLAALEKSLKGARLCQTNDEAENEEEADDASDHYTCYCSLSELLALWCRHVHRVVGLDK